MKHLKVLSVAFMVTCLGLSHTTRADNIELALLLDGSASLGQVGWDAQLDAYVSIFNENFHSTMMHPDDDLYVSIFQFDGSFMTPAHPSVHRLIDQTLVDDDTAATSFATLLANLSNEYHGFWTDIGTAIGDATEYLTGDETIVGDRMIIDVSTDGVPTMGGTVDEVVLTPEEYALHMADLAGAAGITVNALGVGDGADLDFLADLALHGGGGFSLHAESFSEFEDTLKTKLFREINTVTPEPSSYVLLALGVCGLILIKRKTKTA